MANINDSSAMSALNEKDYINKLYDTNLGNQNKVLQDNFNNDNALLNETQQGTQQTTDQYVNRTEVESQKADSLYGNGGLSAGAQAQVNLNQENTRRRNTNVLREAQQNADAEYERQRQLLAQQYESEIRKAQANNDMERAQALYEAAKAEDEQYLALRKQAASLMASKGDNSLMDAIAAGTENTAPENTGDTWAEVLKNEGQINSVYDSELEALKQKLYQDYATGMSDLEAERLKAMYKTDQQLNDAYTEAMQKAKNYAEVQGAYGQTSGTGAQAELARDAGLQDRLTDIRALQIGTDAGYGMEGFDLGAALRKAQAEAQAEIDSKRAQALYDAAEGEEQTLLENQQFVGNYYADKGNYEMLGRLYGLTPDQIDRLMGRGKYAYVPEPVYRPGNPNSRYKFDPKVPAWEDLSAADQMWYRNS